MNTKEARIQFTATLLSILECPENVTREIAQWAFDKYLNGTPIEEIASEIE